MEIWKNILGYEGLYQVSNLGRIKSLSRLKKIPINNGYGVTKERILKQCFRNKNQQTYLCVSLRKDGLNKMFNTHSLVAMCFLGHILNGREIHVDHIDNNRLNNNLNNLQLITSRENTSKGFKNIKTTSIYTGVTKQKNTSKWRSRIEINGNVKNLGNFKNEYDAHIAYQKELNKIKNI